MSVDELVELLWPETEPGVGSRRLRNVLWRIRSVFGDLVEREGNFIRLSPAAHTDIAQFEGLACRALSDDCSAEEASLLAEAALSMYGGVLLPDDLYADWATGYRETLALLQVRVLDFLLALSCEGGHFNESLSLLERLIEIEPFEEAHYLQAAEIYALSGHLSRARSTIERCSHMLNELGVAPCPALLRAREGLSLT
jgi:DNA-binding SARP family transcriptional activator